MTKNGEEGYVTRCLSLIEFQLGWGTSEGWVNYDFEKLSDAIQESTQVQLSVTTLKRIWGKLKYDSAPTLTTLNTLAQFAGYEDWRTFKQTETISKEQEPSKEEFQPVVAPQQVVTTRKSLNYYWLLLIVPFTLLGYALIPKEEKPKEEESINARLFSFKADKMVSEGVPNSVVFHYDAKAAKTDSVFIAQTWDVSRKKLVSKDQTAHSAIYYYPGFFQSKLIIDKVVVKTHDIWITSNGWLCLAEKDPVPLYFKKEECIKDKVVSVDETLLKKYNLALHPEPPKIRIFNERDMGNLMSDNFIFETTLKNDFNNGTNACQSVQVLIQCKNDIIIIPLATKPCVGNLQLSFCGYYVSSKEADLSQFGADLNQWTNLRVVVKDKNASIYINNKLAHFLVFSNEATGVVGVQYRFNGTGAVKDTRFINDGKEIPFN